MTYTSPRIEAAAEQLLAPPTREQDVLLRCIGDVFLQRGYGPVWQYVAHTLSSSGLDAEEVVAGLPRVAGHRPQAITYSPIAHGGHQPIALDQRVVPTIAGLRHLEGTALVIETYLRLLDALETGRRQAVADPEKVVVLGIDEATLVKMLPAGAERALPFVKEILRYEPFVWRTTVNPPLDTEDEGVPLDDLRRRGYWDPSPSIGLFAGCSSVVDYVTRMVGQLLPAEPASEPVAPSPLSLASALDYLDVVWRSVFNQHLVVLPGAEKTARLAFDVATPEEFDNRLSALADVLSRLNTKTFSAGPGGGGHPLERLAAGIPVRLPTADRSRIQAVQGTLSAATDLRNGLQHSDKSPKLLGALDRLRLAYPITDYAGAWATITAQVVAALNNLRELVQEAAASSEPVEG